MVVVGGYVGDTLLCDSPGTYVYDMSAAEWVNEFTPTSNPETNPQSKQSAQLGDPLALQGSYGYAVPHAVQEVVGGGASGGATVTAPAATATSGPIATGQPKRYKLPPGTGGQHGPSNDSGANGGGGDSSSGTNVGAIVAGVVAGILLVALLYLAFVTWLYRKRLKEYKRNIDNLGGKTSREARRRVRHARNRNRSPSGYGGGGDANGDYDYDALAVADSARSSSPDSLAGREPTFVGIMLSPRRSLRVTNPDPD